MFLKRKYLSEDALANLKKYKYHAGSYSALDMALQPWWEGCVKFLPLWMAPNLVTLIGLLA